MESFGKEWKEAPGSGLHPETAHHVTAAQKFLLADFRSAVSGVRFQQAALSLKGAY